MQFRAFQAVGGVPTRDVKTAVERGSSPSVSAEKMRTTALVRHTCMMATRSDPLAQVVSSAAEVESDRASVARRYAVAAERRRLLTHALHSDRIEHDAAAAEFASEHAVTGRFVRLDAADIEASALCNDAGELARGTQEIDSAAFADVIAPVAVAEGSAPAVRPQLGELVEQLRVQAAACRAKAIALNAKLGMLEADRAELRVASGEVHAVREQLIEGSARIDHAIEEIGAVTAVELQLSTLR